MSWRSSTCPHPIADSVIGDPCASDRLGRERVGCSFLALGIAGGLWFFLLARGPLSLFAALIVTYTGQFGAWPTLSGFTTELFPTSQRALARSAVGAATVTGPCVSFLLAAVLIRLTGSLASSVEALAAGPVTALVIVAACLPETAGKELEETATELA